MDCGVQSFKIIIILKDWTPAGTRLLNFKNSKILIQIMYQFVNPFTGNHECHGKIMRGERYVKRS